MCLTSMVGLVIEKMSQYLSDGLSLRPGQRRTSEWQQNKAAPL
jgi:hypothetical protein